MVEVNIPSFTKMKKQLEKVDVEGLVKMDIN